MNDPGNVDDERLVVPLTDVDPESLAEYGGKGARLGALARNGFAVPDGFCVTTGAYDSLLTDEIRDAIRSLDGIDPTDRSELGHRAQWIRESIRARELPAESRARLWTTLSSRDATSYAVRSSATAEDLPSASFAGQHDTYLGVEPDAVGERIRDCMASLFTERAVTYRSRNAISHADVALAVVVQEMVDADAAGVLFTADPDTGNRTVAAIDAALGLGETVVAGDVEADDARVKKSTGEVLSYDVGTQRERLVLDDGRTKHAPVSASDGAARVLSDTQLAELVELGRRVESLFGSPQDIEWALVDDDPVVLQSRPITSLFPLPDPLPRDDRLHVYYSMGHAQAFAEALPPLVRDVWVSYIRLWIGELGMNPQAQWAVEAGGRIYVDMTAFLRIGAFRRRAPAWLAALSEPLGAALDDLLDRRAGEFQAKRPVCDSLTSLRRCVGAVRKDAGPITGAMIRGFFGAFVGTPNPPEHEEAVWNAWGRTAAARVRAFETPTERALAVVDPDETGFDSLPRIGPLYAAFVAEGLLRRRFPDAPEDLDAVGRGFPDELVTRINLGLGDLADVARDHPPVADAIERGSSIDAIGSLEGGDEFRDALDEYLDAFGHRATGELDISRPRWREDPSGLLAAVRANLEHGEKGRHRERIRRLERAANEAAARLERRAGRGILGPVRKRLVRQLIRTYRGYIQTREYPKHGTAHLLAAWHDALRDAGEDLAAEGVPTGSDDVWFLRTDELIAALDGEAIDVDVAARRAEFERHAAMDAPPLLTSEGEAPNAAVEREDVPDGALVGTGVSSGVVEGTARVVRDPSEETIEPGEILIAPSSDPGWTPLFLNAAGMVVEVGGRMSHGALVAREYGLPAVVSVPGATRRIETGQRVRIDGTRGIVEIVAAD